MLRWALTGTDAEKVTTKGNTAHSGFSGVYETGKETVEGKTDRINNIYDLEGNGYEWTAEAMIANCRSTRGGSYNGGGAPDYRDYSTTISTSDYYCSRSLLYIK